MIIFINFFSRTQKLKFKEVYKKDFDGLIISHIISFLLSLLIPYIFFYSFYKINKGENISLQKKDKWIITLIAFDSILMIFFSLYNGLTSSPIISILAISLSGNVNFLFYEYFSTQQVEYTSLSGLISINQTIFRAFEFDSYEDNFGYVIQSIYSFAGIILCIIYLTKEFEERNIY